MWKLIFFIHGLADHAIIHKQDDVQFTFSTQYCFQFETNTAIETNLYRDCTG
jgi:hypothetical protein